MSIKKNDRMVPVASTNHIDNTINISNIGDTIQLTDEAVKHIEARRKELEALIYAEAINEALSTRGEPIEVTASDVSLANDKVLHMLLEEIYTRNQRYSNRSKLDRLARAYTYIGRAMLLITITVFLIVRPAVSNGSEVVLYTSLILGFVTVLLPDIMKFLLKTAKRFMKNRLLDFGSNDFYNLIIRG